MPKKSHRRPLKGDDKVVYIVVRGRSATTWRRLLREEDGTNQYHGLAALEAYIKAKGYDSEPKKPTPPTAQ